MPVGKKRYELRYSQKLHEKREHNIIVYKPHFLDLLAQNCVRDIEEAKKRVKIVKGKYRYHPSQEYLHYHFKHCKNNSLW